MALQKISAKDIALILPQLVRQKEYQQYVERKVRAEIETIRKNIITDFNNHPVTLEIEQGIKAQNISKTLGGVTNLYSFIGFDEGSDPIQPIRRQLEKINIIKSRSPRGTITYRVEFPTAKDIFAVTPMPWAIGRSWAKGIELGISGIGYYLKVVLPQSRSGLGIQSKYQVRKGIRFKNVKYISDLINRYKADIKKLEKQIL